MALRVALLLPLLAACNSVLGLDEPSAVTGRYAARALRNGPSGPLAEIVTRPDTLVVRTLDPPETLAPDSAGRFAFLVPHSGDLVRLALMRDNIQLAEFQLANDDIDIALPIFGRPERNTKIPMGTGIGYMISNATGANPDATVATTGIWTQATRPTGQGNTNFTIPWATATPLTPPLGMLDGTAGDRAYFLLFDRIPATGTATHVGITKFREDIVTLSAGTSIQMGTAMPADTSSCVHLRAPVMAEVARLTAAGFTNASMTMTRNWEIIAQPAPLLGPAGLVVARAPTIPTTATDVDAQIMVANPFPGHTLAVRMFVAATQDVTAPGAMIPATPFIETVHYADASGGCTTTAAITPSAALPADARLAGAEGTVTLDRSTDPTLTWTNKSGTADRYAIALREVTAIPDACGTPTTTIGSPLAMYVTTAPSVLIDRAQLAMGKSYVFQITSELGLPNASKGDLYTSALPYAASVIYTSVFTIAN